MPDEVVIVTTDPENGDTVEVTIKKDDKATKEGKKGERGSIRTRRWKKGKDPKKDKPYEDKSHNLYGIKVKNDFSKITAEVEVDWAPDITLTITLDCPDPPKKPSIRIKHIKADTTYEISPEIKKKITSFLKDSKFPVLAAISTEKQEEEKEETILAKDLRDSLKEVKQEGASRKPVSTGRKVAGGIFIVVIIVIGIVFIIDIWDDYPIPDIPFGEVRNCIKDVIGGDPPDCSDTSERILPTTCNGRDIGEMSYSQAVNICR